MSAINGALTSLWTPGLPDDYYQQYTKAVAAVTKADVLRVAKKYIEIDRLAIVIVGDRASIEGAAQGDQHRANRVPRYRGRSEDAVAAWTIWSTDDATPLPRLKLF